MFQDNKTLIPHVRDEGFIFHFLMFIYNIHPLDSVYLTVRVIDLVYYEYQIYFKVILE